MSKPADPLMGLKTFTIGGRMVDRRQRCLGMTDEERRWRAQWLKDQVLSPEEPKYVPEYYKETTNVFRRMWKTPFNAFEKILQPVLGVNGAYLMRHFVGKGLVVLGGIYLFTYYIKYHADDFTVYRNAEFRRYPVLYPDDPDYGKPPYKKPPDYYDQGFYSSVLCQEVEIPEPPPPPPPPAAYKSDIECPLPGDDE